MNEKMNLEFVGKTNYEDLYVNTIDVVANVDGKFKQFTIDRDQTEWTYDEQTGDIKMLWRNVYIWDGEVSNYEIPDNSFDLISVVSVNLEEDDWIPEDYFCVVEYINQLSEEFEEEIYKSFILSYLNDDENKAIINKLPDGSKQLIWILDFHTPNEFFSYYYGQTYRELLLNIDSIADNVMSQIEHEYDSLQDACNSSEYPKQVLMLFNEKYGFNFT